MVTIWEFALVWEPLLLVQVMILPKLPLEFKQLLPLHQLPVVWPITVSVQHHHATNAILDMSQLSLLVTPLLEPAQLKLEQLVSQIALFTVFFLLLIQSQPAKPVSSDISQIPLDHYALLAQLGTHHAQEMLPSQQVKDGSQLLDGQHALDQLLTTVYGLAQQQHKLILPVSLDTI